MQKCPHSLEAAELTRKKNTGAGQREQGCTEACGWCGLTSLSKTESGGWECPVGTQSCSMNFSFAGKPLQGFGHSRSLKSDLLVAGQLRGCVTRDGTQALCYHAIILNYC